jgi:hypothetical protein
MGNNSDDDISQVIDLIHKIEADAYKRGQNDAVARIVAAAQGEMHVTADVQAATTEAKHPSMNGADQPPKRRPGGVRGAKRAARGSVPKYVHQVLADPHYQGANYDGIIDRVRELGGTDIAPASIRNYLRSAEKNREVRRQNDFWFLSQPPWGREGENRADPQPGESQPL